MSTQAHLMNLLGGGPRGPEHRANVALYQDACNHPDHVGEWHHGVKIHYKDEEVDLTIHVQEHSRAEMERKLLAAFETLDVQVRAIRGRLSELSGRMRHEP